MLYLLRSNFRSNTHRVNFLQLLHRVNLSMDPLLEIPFLEAPKAVTLALKLRKQAGMKESTLVLGSSPGEGVRGSVETIDELRNLHRPLAKAPVIVLVHPDEWLSYAEVAKAPAPITFFDRKLTHGRVLFLEQRESYGDHERFAIIAHLIPDDIMSSRNADSTVEVAVGLNARKVREDEETGPQALHVAKADPEDERITELPPPPKFDPGKGR